MGDYPDTDDPAVQAITRSVVGRGYRTDREGSWQTRKSVRAMMPYERYQDVKVGDLIILTRDNYGAIRYFGKIQVVTWVQRIGWEDRVVYSRENDWIKFIRKAK